MVNQVGQVFQADQVSQCFQVFFEIVKFVKFIKFVKLVKLVWLVKGCDQERNKMKLKGADLEHEQHEALVQHFQVMTLFVICFHTKISNEVNKN